MEAQILQSAYDGGSVQDPPRHQLPPRSVWKMTDFFPNLDGAPLAKRGGWGVLPGTFTGASSMKAVSYAPFTSGDQIVAIDDRIHLWTITSAGVATDRGVLTSFGTPTSRPVFFNGKIIIPSYVNSGVSAKKFDGTTVSTITSAPSGFHGLSYRARLVLANNDTLSFSAVLDENTWDVDSFVKSASRITGIAALSNMIAIFHAGSCERLRGTTPPSSTSAGDMTLEPMFEEGCIDARSIVTYNDQVIWANENGVHISDGASIANLIEKGGLRQFWTGLFGSYDASTWTVAAGIYGDYYIISLSKVLQGGGVSQVGALACSLSSKRWLFLNNFRVSMFAESYGVVPELHMAIASTPKIGLFSTCLTPGPTYTHDGDGTAVEPSIEFPYFRAGMGLSRWREIYVGTDVYGSDGGYFQVKYLTSGVTNGPFAPSYADVLNDDGTEFRIPKKTGYSRDRVPLNLAAQGLGVMLVQVGASDHSRVFDLEAVVHEREGRY